jgi:hypothetical protein
MHTACLAPDQTSQVQNGAPLPQAESQARALLRRLANNWERRAQLQCGLALLASASSMPCWRGVGVIAPRRWLCGARQPPYRTRWTRGSGTSAASFSNTRLANDQRLGWTRHA